MIPFSLEVPASTTEAPSFMRELEIRPGTPVAVMIISYCLSFVKSLPRWKRSTLRSEFLNILNNGAPTSFPRPTMAIFL